MGATTEKVYSLKIEASQAQQALDATGKLLNDLKAKAAAANQEQRETQQVYRENAAALKELTAQQKQLEAARSKAAPGQMWMQANAAAEKNLVTLKRLNTTVEESRIDYLAAKEAATQAGAAVGQQAAKVKELAAGVKEYKTQAAAAAQQFAPGTFGAISKEVEDLKARLLDLVPGSAEAAQAIQQLADKQSSLRQLANATNSANPRAQARAFGVLSGALLGLTGVATTVMQVWGLSDEKAQKYGQAIQGVVSVLYSAEQINKLLNKENLSLISSITSGAKAWLGFGTAAEAGGVAATTAGRATKAAVASTGIGLLVLAVGALISLFLDWNSKVRSSESTFTQYKAAVVGGFEALLAAGKDWVKFWLQLFTLDISGAITTARNAGRDVAGAYAKGRAEVIAEAQRAEIKAELEKSARYIEIVKSRGEDTLAWEVQVARRKIEAEKANSKEQLDAIRDYLVLKNQYLKRAADEERANSLARLDGLEKIEAANGRAVIEQQRKVLQEKLLQQIEADALAGRYDTAAQRQLNAEMQALNDAYDKEQLEKRQAAVLAGLNAGISLRKAKGREAYAQEVAEAQQELAFLRSAAQQNMAAIIAAQGRIADLKAARQVELTERAHAAELASLDASIALQNAKGEDSFKAQVAREERQLQFLRQAGIVSLAAVRAQLGKIAAMKAAQQVKEDNEERAAELARQQVRINMLKTQGEDTTQLELSLKATELNTLLNAAQKNQAAIINKQGEIDALTEQQQVTAAERKRARMIEDFENDTTIREKQGKDELARRIKFQQALVALDEKDTSKAGIERMRADLQKLKEMQAEMAQRGPNLGSDILQRIFGVKEEDVQLVKDKLNKAYSEISQSVGQLANAFLEAATQQTEQALAAAQQQLQNASQQLSEIQSKAQQTAQQLDSATGARRDYLLGKLAKERAETERLAAVKAKAAAEEKKQQQEAHRLQKIGMELTAASALATNVAAAASAVYAGIKAVEKGTESAPFPFNLIAIAASVAAVVAAVASAKQLATAVKYEAGGMIEGPSHSRGGVPFMVAGRPGFEAEGGEFIVRKSVVAQPGILPMLHQINNMGRVRVAASPSSYFADGGLLSKGAGVSGGYASASSVAGLQAEQQRTNILLAAVLEAGSATAQAATTTAQHTAATAQHTAELKEKDPVVKWDFEAEQGRRKVGQQLNQAEGFLKG